MRELSDKALIALARAGDIKSAFEELTRRYRPMLMSFIYSIGAGDENADDIAQQALMKAFTHLDQYRGDAAFKTWLFSIALREKQQHDRREGSKSRLTRLLNDEMALAPTLTTTNHQGNEHQIDLTAALNALSQDERTVLLLCDAFEFTHTEAAALTKQPLGTLKSKIRRARAKTMRLLEQAVRDQS